MLRRKFLQATIIIIYVACIAVAVHFRLEAARSGHAGHQWLYDLLIGLLITTGALIFEPVRERIRRFFRNIFTGSPSKLRVLMYGLGRSGKSTAIESFLMVDNQVKHVRNQSTQGFEIQSADVRLRSKNKKYPVSIADYKGQRPAEIVTDAPQVFFGHQGERKINAILFVVDLFPENKDKNDKVIEDEELIRRYESNAEQLIMKHVLENRLYLNRFSLQPVFTVAYSKENLFAVRLLINKADLLQELISKRYLSNVSVYDYAINLYSDTIETIGYYCERNQIHDFDVRVISASRGLLYTQESQPRNISPVFGEVLNVYADRQGG